ncbi:hypothetical protein O181_024239 [Austropuccinia psidii MF-1]|uniref:Uncharacterized protein n=1 Tax=Austropuccinia psidii MF-1 TaxID=1389203 RepID=A0A9Q3GZG8_9BASI|nr:hypothetical protein [Austropuccinia psidii MF-1]
MSWFVALVQDPNASHASYACAGFQYFKQLLTPGQAANASHANHYACTSSQQFKQLPTPLQVPKNLKVSLRWCWLPIIHMQILTLLLVPNNSNKFLRQAGFQKFTCESLRVCRFQQC